MKARIIKLFIFLAVAFITLPVFSQDYLEVRTINGNYSKFFVDSISSIFISNYDENGVKQNDYGYQHIMTPNQDYVFTLSDIDYISFTKYDEKTALEIFDSAMSAILLIIWDCNNINEAENLLSSIKEVDGVEEAWSDGHILSVKIESNGTVHFYFNHDIQLEDEINYLDEILADYDSSTKKNSPRRNNTISCNDQLKIGVFNQYANDYDSSRSYYNNRISSFFNGLLTKNISVTNVTPDVSGILSMTNFNIIAVFTHGSLGSVLTSERLGTFTRDITQTYADYTNAMTQTWANYYNITNRYGIKEGHAEFSWVKEGTSNGSTNWVSYLSLKSDYFIEKMTNKFVCPNTIVFNSSCCSAQGTNSIANAFLQAGVGTYVGYDGTNNVGKIANLLMIKKLLDGNAIQSMTIGLPNKYIIDPDYSSHLTVVSNSSTNNPTFAAPVYSEIDPLSLIEDFPNKGTVTLEGKYTLYDPNNTENLSKLLFFYGSDIGNLIQTHATVLAPDNSGNWNFKFSTDISGLENGKTYYFKAAHFGTYETNEGDIKSFVPGSPCPDNRHPHMIDMGDGISVSCRNVGATNPWENGEFYAWGETEKKQEYTWDNYNELDPNTNDIASTENDVAKKIEGECWKMPSVAEVEKLLKNCTAKPFTLHGTKGFLLQSKITKNVIFLPAAGSKAYQKHEGEGERGWYYTSTRDPKNSKKAKGFYFYDNSIKSDGGESESWTKFGHTVRPIVNKDKCSPQTTSFRP